MEALDRSYPKGLLSPEPKRIITKIDCIKGLIIPRSSSCDLENPFIVAELNDILGLTNFPPGRNSSPLLSGFSEFFLDRTESNPIIFDEKFIQMEYSLSTSEDSGSDSDRIVQSN